MMRLTKFNPETGQYEFHEVAKTQEEFIAQRKAVIQRLGEFEDKIKQGDVVEVCRCKDCKYYTEHYDFPYGGYSEYGRCDHPQQEYDTECFDMWVTTLPDDFCSYGERRQEDTE